MQTANVYITFLTFSEFLISFFLDHESHYFTFWWFRLKNRRMRTYIKSFLIDLTREWQRGEGTGSNQKMVEGYWVWKRNLGWHRKGNSRKIRRNQKGGHLTELMSGGRRGGGEFNKEWINEKHLSGTLVGEIWRGHRMRYMTSDMERGNFFARTWFWNDSPEMKMYYEMKLCFWVITTLVGAVLRLIRGHP